MRVEISFSYHALVFVDFLTRWPLLLWPWGGAGFLPVAEPKVNLEARFGMARITKRLVDGCAVPEVRQVLWDDTLKGFGVILRPSGVHSFVFSYRNAKNRKRNITIAKVGTIAPDMARQKAEEYRALLLQGRDPLEEKQVARDRLTVSGLIDAYLSSSAFTGKRSTTQYVDH